MFRILKVLASALSALFLIGCEMMADEVKPNAVSEPLAAFAARQAALTQISNWRAVGRLALKADGEGWTATVSWDNKPDRWRIRLSGPLGQGTVQLTGTPEEVILARSDGSKVRAMNADQLLERALGWRMPVSGLRYWMKGDIDPSVPADALVVGDAGLLEGVRQSGWTVRIPSYMDAKGIVMPREIILTNPRVDARITVRRWRVTPTESP